MSADALLSPTGSSQPDAPEFAGTPGRKTGDLESFKTSGDGGAPGSGRGSAAPGKSSKEKKKIGRPPKNGAGFSAAKIEEVVVDPEIEAAREEFESVLVELLVSTTDNLADSRFEILKIEFPEAVARGMADKAKLTDKERKYFGGVAVRLWRKYLGDKYLFTDEGIAAVYALQYFLRNAEGMSQARKISAKINGKNNDQRPVVPGPASPGPGNNGNGKDHIGDKVDLLTPRASGPGI